MSISRLRRWRRRWDWHPGVHHFLGIGILVLLSVGAVQVAESAGSSTEVTFDEALEAFRGDPAEAEEPTPAETPAAVEEREPDAGATTPEAVSPDQAGPAEPAPPAPAPAPAPAPSPAAGPATPEPPRGQAGAAEPEPPAPFTPPAPGVYRYRATGGEWLNMPGANRTYPEESFATVRQRGDCRWTFEHRVAQEHVDQRQYCSNPGELLFISGETRVTFFGQSDGTTIACDPPAVMVRMGDEPGATHSSTCEGDGTQTTETTTYLGRDDVEVGGVVVSAHHIRFEAEISGRATGRSDSRVWLHPDTGLMLRVERQTDTTTNAFGGRVRYQEEATFELADLEPRT